MSLEPVALSDKWPVQWDEIFAGIGLADEKIKAKILKISKRIASHQGDFSLEEFFAQKQWISESKHCQDTGKTLLASLRKLKHAFLDYPQELQLTKEEICEEFSRIENPKDRKSLEKVLHARVVVFYDASIDTCMTNLSGERCSLILASAPKTEEQLVQFCELAWQANVGQFVTAADEHFLPFWPVVSDKLAIDGAFSMHLLNKQTSIKSEESEQKISNRTLKFCKGKEERQCRQLHLKNWKDMCSYNADLLQEAVKWLLTEASKESCTLVHCEMGIGRTGVIALLMKVCSSLLDQLYDGVPISKLEFKIAERLHQMRTEIRPCLVMTPEQYISVYKTLRRLYFWLIDSCDHPSSQSKRQKRVF